MQSVEFFFDVGSPNAYLAHRLIPALAARTGAEFIYVPCLLGGIFKATGNQSPATAYAHIRNKFAYEQLEMQRFIDQHALHEFRMNPFFPVNTLLAMRGAVAAESLGVLAAYTQALFHAMWEEGRQLDDAAVFAQTLQEAGLDAAAIVAASARPEVKQALIDHTAAAVARGAFGLPTFFIGTQMWFGKDRLRDVEEHLLATAAR